MLNKINKELKNLDKSGKDIRNFGVLFALILVALVLFFDFSIILERCLLIGALYFILGISQPVLIKYPFIAWMALSFLLGELVFKILFTFFYFTLICPIGFLMKVVKGDFLEKKYDKSATTYWKEYGAKRQSKGSLENLF